MNWSAAFRCWFAVAEPGVHQAGARQIRGEAGGWSRGRRFANLNDEQLTENWIAAVRTWLARKGPVTELAMDDLTAELRLRGFEPPYDAMNRELAARFFEFNKAAQKKVATRFARHLTAFLGQRDKLLH